MGFPLLPIHRPLQILVYLRAVGGGGGVGGGEHSGALHSSAACLRTLASQRTFQLKPFPDAPSPHLLMALPVSSSQWTCKHCGLFTWLLRT